jgi:hypothetical protein
MKTLFSIFLLACATCSALAQQRVLQQAEFDRVFKASYEIWTVWSGKAFRKTVLVESRSPNKNYKLSRVVEFDGKGASRAVYNEHVEGKEPRLTREVIGVGSTSYIRDAGKRNWWLRGDAKREETHAYLAYAPDPLEVQAVRAHFVRSQFETKARERFYAFAGTDRIKDETVNIYKATERIEGVEKKSGLHMLTEAVMRYWFGRDGMILRSESVSNGYVGKDLYYLKITATWEVDPSISIDSPAPPPS